MVNDLRKDRIPRTNVPCKLSLLISIESYIIKNRPSSFSRYWPGTTKGNKSVETLNSKMLMFFFSISSTAKTTAPAQHCIGRGGGGDWGYQSVIS